MPIPQSITLSVVGSPYPNRDGSNRKFEILLCERGELLRFEREPDNRFDEHAIAVFSRRNVQIGYINSERAPYVAALMRAGHVIKPVFQQAMPWGAAVRVGIDQDPVIPPQSSLHEHPSMGGHQDEEFFSDFIPPDDWDPA